MSKPSSRRDQAETQGPTWGEGLPLGRAQEKHSPWGLLPLLMPILLCHRGCVRGVGLPRGQDKPWKREGTNCCRRGVTGLVESLLPTTGLALPPGVLRHDWLHPRAGRKTRFLPFCERKCLQADAITCFTLLSESWVSPSQGSHLWLGDLAWHHCRCRGCGHRMNAGAAVCCLPSAWETMCATPCLHCCAQRWERNEQTGCDCISTPTE